MHLSLFKVHDHQAGHAVVVLLLAVVAAEVDRQEVEAVCILSSKKRLVRFVLIRNRNSERYTTCKRSSVKKKKNLKLMELFFLSIKVHDHRVDREAEALHHAVVVAESVAEAVVVQPELQSK